MTRRASVRLLATGAFYTAMAAIVTWPQARVLARAFPNQVDAYFDVWRLAWIAHQLPRDPAHLFDANIFYPEVHTLAYSDALLAAGFAAAPLFWLHVNPVLIYNLVFLGGLALSGVATFLLVRDLTGDAAAALVAGALFVGAPYRFDHFVHLELQLTMFMPLALWAMHRSIERERWSWSLMVGFCLALQVYCSIYYGIFFATLFPVVAAFAVLIAARRRAGALGRLAAAALIAGLLVFPYFVPYLAGRQTVGVRDPGEVLYYSAMPQDYGAARSDNPLYGGRLGDGGEERHLFPGVTPLVLTAVALWPPVSSTAVIYIVAAALAFEASLGLHGYLFPWLREWLLPYHGLRVPARFGMLVALMLAILGGDGFARLSARLTSQRARWALAMLIVCVMILEAGRTPPLTQQPTSAALVDKWLRDQPASAVVELPLPPPGQPFQESEGQPVYHSIFHWQKILNGTSGFFPPSYLQLLDRMASFPDTESLRYLKTREVRYVVARAAALDRARIIALRRALTGRPEIAAVWRFPEPDGDTFVFELAR